MRTIIYVDGFNLYYGALRDRPVRWLNLLEMSDKHLAAHHEIVGVKYFTAKVNPRPNNPGQALRQNLFLRAISTLPNTEIFYGHFLTRETMMPVVNPASGQQKHVRVWKTEEKGSDVRLATELVNDAHLDRFDCAVVISGDSDLLPPVETVMEELKKPVGVLNPQRHPCTVLKKQATFYKHLRPKVLERCQFPDRLTDSQGVFHKPKGW